MAKRKTRRPATTKKRTAPDKNNKLAIVFIFIIAQVIFFGSSLFQLKAVDISGDDGMSKSEIARNMNSMLGKNIFSINLSDIKKSLKDNFRIKDITISYSFPGKLKIIVKNKKPQAVVCNDRDKVWHEMSQDGDILNVCGDPNGSPRLIKVAVTSPVKPGLKIDTIKISEAKKIINCLPESVKNNTDYILINSSDEFILNGKFLNKNLEINLGEPVNLEYKMKLLTNILDKAAALQLKVSNIDLRYEQPVIKASGR